MTSDGTPTFVLARFGEAPVLELAPVILQAFACARRRAQQEQACRQLQQQLGRTVLPQLPVKRCTWAGCRHTIMLRSQRPLYEVRSSLCVASATPIATSWVLSLSRSRAMAPRPTLHEKVERRRTSLYRSKL